MASKIFVDFVSDIFIDGDRMERSTWVFIGKLAWGKGSVRIPKSLFSTNFAKILLIQLTHSFTLGA